VTDSRPTGLAELDGLLTEIESHALTTFGSGYVGLYLEVTSKRAALLWAEQVVDPRWLPLLEQVRLDRARGWGPAEPPRPGSLESALEFVAECQELAASR